MEASTLTPRNLVHGTYLGVGACPGYYGISMYVCVLFAQKGHNKQVSNIILFVVGSQECVL